VHGARDGPADSQRFLLALPEGTVRAMWGYGEGKVAGCQSVGSIEVHLNVPQRRRSRNHDGIPVAGPKGALHPVIAEAGPSWSTRSGKMRMQLRASRSH
jgi:hypothetical protein